MIAGYTDQELTSIAVISAVVALLVFIQGAALLTILLGGVVGFIAAAIGIRVFRTTQ